MCCDNGSSKIVIESVCGIQAEWTVALTKTSVHSYQIEKVASVDKLEDQV